MLDPEIIHQIARIYGRKVSLVAFDLAELSLDLAVAHPTTAEYFSSVPDTAIEADGCYSPLDICHLMSRSELSFYNREYPWRYFAAVGLIVFASTPWGSCFTTDLNDGPVYEISTDINWAYELYGEDDIENEMERRSHNRPIILNSAKQTSSNLEEFFSKWLSRLSQK